MKLPRPRFTVRRLMIAVVVVAAYLAAIHQSPQVGLVLAFLTVPPLLWVAMRATRRSETEVPMSAVEWAAHFLIASLITFLLLFPAIRIIDMLFPVYST